MNDVLSLSVFAVRTSTQFAMFTQRNSNNDCGETAQMFHAHMHTVNGLEKNTDEIQFECLSKRRSTSITNWSNGEIIIFRYDPNFRLAPRR